MNIAVVIPAYKAKDHIVNVVNIPKIRVLKKVYKSYKIILDVEKTDNKNATGRYQIDWLDKYGVFMGASLTPLNVKKGRHIYTSSMIQDIPKNAHTGIFYLTYHDKVAIKIHAINNGKHLNSIYKNYNKKFPYLSDKF